MLDQTFGQALFKSLMRDGFSQESIETVLDEIREIAFTTTSNRSVLGTMNDMASIIKWTVHDGGGLGNVDIFDTMRKLNRMPLGPIDYKFSIEMMHELLG